jgi:Tfp pilus assembly protein PilO
MNTYKKIDNNEIKKPFSINFKIFIVLIFFLIVGVGFIFLVYPKYQNIIEAKQENEKLENSFLKTAQEIKNLQNVVNNFKKIDQATINKIDNLLIKKEINEELFSYFSFVILRNGAVVNSITINEKNIKESTHPKEIEILRVNLDISGVNYLVLKNLLKEFENSMLITDVQKFDFNPSKNSLIIEVDVNYLK